MEKYYEAYGANQEEGAYFNGSSLGGAYDLEVILDTKSLFITAPFRSRHNSEEAFIYLSINHFKAPFNTYYSKKSLQMGQMVTMHLTPLLLASTEALHGLEKQDRKCRFSDEAEDLKSFL